LTTDKPKLETERIFSTAGIYRQHTLQYSSGDFMINQIINLSLRSRLLMLVLAVVVIATGYRSYQGLPVDAFPDVSPNLVQIFCLNTSCVCLYGMIVSDCVLHQTRLFAFVLLRKRHFDNLVQIFTITEGLAPEEIEMYVTYPVEAAMTGLPAVEKIRSVSNFGLSVVNVYFEELNFTIQSCMVRKSSNEYLWVSSFR
jgi:cobalt-zinc-cadmium resistance protein CzcA